MIDLIVFSVKNNKYAINIENVRRIIPIAELTTIPNAHPFINGMMSYEDSVVKVLDFRMLTDLPPHADENKSLEDSSLKFLFYENENEKFAIKVDSIDDITHIEESEIMSKEDDADTEFLRLDGVIDIDGVLINLIKTIKLPT